jgi:short-subunit dehydrogenase
VARAAIDGLDRGRLVVLPGSLNRVGATMAHLTPRSLLVPILARSHPGLKH